MWAWGYNNYGQLGDGTNTDSSTPVAVEGLTEAVAVAAGSTHSLALKQDGTVVAWGNGYGGALGDGTTTSSNIPVEVEGLTDAVAVAAGISDSLALKQDGSVVAWGENRQGELGNGTTTSSSTPVAVEGITDAVAVAAGGWYSLVIEAPYTFSGFFSPVDNSPTINWVKVGKAVPVKFSLSGNQGLNIFATDYPKSQQIDCDSTASIDNIEQTVTAGESSLSYDATTDTDTYTWKTEKTWAGTCRQFSVKFDDGTVQRANFRFK